jgi:uridine kinase
MAIRVLLDHDVKEENIVFMTLLGDPAGLASVARVFPNVKVVTSEVWQGWNGLFDD